MKNILDNHKEFINNCIGELYPVNDISGKDCQANPPV